ncbi:MAG: CARDB domain-containing protein [Candidatus Micrarchaeia archaeon]
MKISYAIIAFALIAIANAQTAGIGMGALSISNLIITPNPVLAGSKVQISFQLYNSYQYSLQNVNLYLEGSYPLLNYSPQSIGQISSIGQGLYGGVGYYISYNITVPKNVPSGVYTLELYATYQTTQLTNTGAVSYTQPVTAYSTIPITIHVIGRPSIAVSSSVTQQITPGEPFSLMLNIMNNGYDTAKNITISLLPTSEFRPSGTANVSIGALPIGSSVQVPVVIFASQSIENSTYAIPVLITYYSELGNRYLSNSSIYITPAVGSPNITVSFIGSMPPMLYSGYNQTLQFAVVNSGSGLARNITVSFSPGKNINLLGSIHKFYIAALPPGGSVNEGVYISSNFTNSTYANLIVNLTYSSPNFKNIYAKSYNESLYIVPSAQFQVIATKSNAYPGATNIPITYTIKNTGNEVAEEVQISFQSIYPITPINSVAYIPKLLPGEEANVTFMVNIDTSGVPGNYPITLFETWKQPNGTPNQLYTGSNNYYAEVLKGTGSNTVFWEIVIVVVVVAIAAIFAGRRPRKKQKA